MSAEASRSQTDNFFVPYSLDLLKIADHYEQRIEQSTLPHLKKIVLMIIGPL